MGLVSGGLVDYIDVFVFELTVRVRIRVKVCARCVIGFVPEFVLGIFVRLRLCLYIITISCVFQLTFSVWVRVRDRV